MDECILINLEAVHKLKVEGQKLIFKKISHENNTRVLNYCNSGLVQLSAREEAKTDWEWGGRLLITRVAKRMHAPRANHK